MSYRGEPIMVIDSEQAWLEFCRVTLERNNYQVYTAPTGREAREILDTHPDSNVALTLVDIRSFEKDETFISALGQLETDFGSVVVVFPTDLTPNRARRAFKMGISDCASKPYDETALLALVEQMLADYRINTIREKPSARTSSNVMVVDDDDDWLVSLANYLPPVDQVVRATSYQEAVNKVLLQTFDLIVVDLRLVDSDNTNFQGMDLIRLVRERDREHRTFTQIIIVSAYGTLEHIRESYRTFNIYYYFDKRYFPPSKYRDSIREALM